MLGFKTFRSEIKNVESLKNMEDHINNLFEKEKITFDNSSIETWVTDDENYMIVNVVYNKKLNRQLGIDK